MQSQLSFIWRSLCTLVNPAHHHAAKDDSNAHIPLLTSSLLSQVSNSTMDKRESDVQFKLCVCACDSLFAVCFISYDIVVMLLIAFYVCVCTADSNYTCTVQLS